MWWFGFVTDW